MRKWLSSLVLVFCCVLIFPAEVRADRIYFNAAQAELPDGAKTACSKVTIDNQGAQDHIEAVSCPPSGDAFRIWHFSWQTDMPLTGTVGVVLDMGMDGTTAYDVCTSVRISCQPSLAGVNFGATSTLLTTNLTAGTGWWEYSSRTTHTAVAVPASTTADQHCVLLVGRDIGNGSCIDNASGNLEIRRIYLTY